MRKINFLVIILWILTLGCDNKHQVEDFSLNLDKALIILNEGNFTYGNASITVYDITNNRVFQNVFENVNHQKLGDIAQSAYIKDGYLYIVVNNSGKIVRLYASSMKLHGQLNGMLSPRYICPLAQNTAITSDLYSPFLYLWDMEQMQIIKKIHIGTSSERMITSNDALFVLSWRNNDKVLKIRLDDFYLSDSLSVAYQPNSLVMDSQGYLWVLSDGGLWEGDNRSEFPALTKIDPEKMTIIKTFVFYNKKISPSHLNINTTGDTLFFIISAWAQTQDSIFGCYKMSVNDTLLPEEPFIFQNNHTFYSLNYIPEEKWLAITDARDFSSNGQVLIYNTQGKLLLTIPAGINPGYVLMKK